MDVKLPTHYQNIVLLYLGMSLHLDMIPVAFEVLPYQVLLVDPVA